MINEFKSITLCIVHNVIMGLGYGSDAGGDGTEECIDCLCYMVSDFKALMEVMAN